MYTLRLFCDVAIERSFSVAAAKHGISQSAASQRIGTLEKQLGVTLIDRSVRPLALTPAGDLFLREAKDLLQRYDRLLHRVTQMNADLKGEVIVEAIYSAGIDWLNHLKDEFEEQQPRVTITLEYKRPDEVYDAVRHQRCDLGILSYPQRWRDVEVIPLRDERMCVVCSPGHELAGRQTVHASELGGFELATFNADLPAGRAIRRYLRDHDVEPAITSEFDNIDTIKSAVAVTSEIAILPGRTVRRETASGTLAAVEMEPELDRPMGIILPRKTRGNGTVSAAAQAFIDYLLAHGAPEVEKRKMQNAKHANAK
ncbi:MAG: LysR family transcriptional regulator [Phycisphaeraceae bacterium]